jgi:hypothetical protein
MPVFISYSHQNSDFAEQLALQMIKHKAKVWIDRWELNVGDSIIDKIQNAIEGSSALLVILSKASVASEWCKKELNAGLIRELDEKRVVVLPVLIEDCTLPMFLRDKKYADFRTNYEDGLREVIGAISAISSDNLGRVSLPEYSTDWSMSWKEERGALTMDVTMVDLQKNHPYTILTTIKLKGNKAATKRHRMFEEEGLGWFNRYITLREFAQHASQDKRNWLRLIDENPVTANYKLRDSKIGVIFTK